MPHSTHQARMRVSSTAPAGRMPFVSRRRFRRGNITLSMHAFHSPGCICSRSGSSSERCSAVKASWACVSNILAVVTAAVAYHAFT